MALGRTQIPEEVSAWVSVFILQLNSAINPVVYTMSAIDCKKRCAYWDNAVVNIWLFNCNDNDDVNYDDVNHDDGNNNVDDGNDDYDVNATNSDEADDADDMSTTTPTTATTSILLLMMMMTMILDLQSTAKTYTVLIRQSTKKKSQQSTKKKSQCVQECFRRE